MKDKNKAWEAYNKKPTRHISDLIDTHTSHNELKVSDERASYALKRIADSLDKIVKIIGRKDG